MIRNHLEYLTLLPLNIKLCKMSCSFFISQVILKLKTNKISVNKTFSYTCNTP